MRNKFSLTKGLYNTTSVKIGPATFSVRLNLLKTVLDLFAPKEEATPRPKRKRSESTPKANG
jgi:hypothetical protein